MVYDLDVAPFTFGSFAPCARLEIQDLHAEGTTGAQAVMLGESGRGDIAPGQTLTSGRGTRLPDGSDPATCVAGNKLQMSFVGTNSDTIHVTVDWAQKTCDITGALLGATVEANHALSVEVTLHGTLTNQPPTANAGAPQTVECTKPAGVAITLDGSRSHDPDNNLALTLWQRGSRTGPVVGEDLQVTLNQGVGTTQYFLRVTDAGTQADEATTTVHVVDTTAPIITAVQAAPNVLWPPNHKLVPVTVGVAVHDSCDPTPTCHIIAVSSNEPVNGRGDGNTAPDWQITGPSTVNLRAERAGNGSGRVYTVTAACQDASGNTAQGTTTVTVPHSH
jgi:hypothetical protein